MAAEEQSSISSIVYRFPMAIISFRIQAFFCPTFARGCCCCMKRDVKIWTTPTDFVGWGFLLPESKKPPQMGPASKAVPISPAYGIHHAIKNPPGDRNPICMNLKSARPPSIRTPTLSYNWIGKRSGKERASEKILICSSGWILKRWCM